MVARKDFDGSYMNTPARGKQESSSLDEYILDMISRELLADDTDLDLPDNDFQQ